MTQEQKIEIHNLHAEGLKVVAEYVRCEARLVQILARLHQTKGYYLFRCECLKQYAIFAWNLPENAASDLVTVATKSCEFASLVTALEKRRATVSKLRKICPVITEKTEVEWLNLVAECSSRIVEKAVARARPEELAPERVTYKSESLLELRLGITEETLSKLKRLQDLLSQKEKKNVNASRALEMLVELGLEKLDPVKKAQRAIRRQEQKSQTVEIDNQNQLPGNAQPPQHLPTISQAISKSAAASRQVKISNRFQKKARPSARRRFSAKLTYAAQLRDQGQCTHTAPSGERCSHWRWLDVHHLKPLPQGGRDELENLTKLCSAHHRMPHFMEERGLDVTTASFSLSK